MSFVESEFQKILQIKKNIHTAIKNKGVDIPNDTYFENYPTEIGKITGGGGDEDTDFSAMLVLEGVVTGFEPSKIQIENETAAILSTI